eukprot:2473847-Alexandrium_andersonii.AAC.1
MARSALTAGSRPGRVLFPSGLRAGLRAARRGSDPGSGEPNDWPSCGIVRSPRSRGASHARKLLQAGEDCLEAQNARSRGACVLSAGGRTTEIAQT